MYEFFLTYVNNYCSTIMFLLALDLVQNNTQAHHHRHQPHYNANFLPPKPPFPSDGAFRVNMRVSVLKQGSLIVHCIASVSLTLSKLFILSFKISVICSCDSFPLSFRVYLDLQYPHPHLPYP